MGDTTFFKLTALVICAASLFNTAFGQGSWQAGRATMYGNDAWSIHKGSCGYGYIRPDEPLGWNVAAMPDVSPDYSDSCGTCYEVKCYPSSFKDGYGESLDRTQACFDSDASLVFRITDTCPCVYPSNAYSNKRWCCGDMPHFDLSVWGFERLADKKWGVIGLQWRRVPCSYQPSHQAPQIANPTPGEQPPAYTPTTVIRDWPDLSNTSVMSIYEGGQASGWWDASYNVQGGSNMNGMFSGSAKCTLTQTKGAIAFKSSPGAFQNHIGVSIYIYMGSNTIIDKGVVMLIGGDKGSCTAVDLIDVKPTGFKPRCSSCSDYWYKWEVYFSAFAGFGAGSIINNARYFKGCGGNTVQQLSYIEIRNYGSSSMNMCVDHVQLV